VFENIEKQRKILSANSEHTLNMEYLIEDNDLVYTMKREEFEKLAENIFSKVFVAMQKNKGEIDSKGIKLASIELVGGGTRIPAFLRVVQQLYKMETARTINSSEAIAKGCALMSAFKNPNFKIPDVAVEELNYYPMTATWDFLNQSAKPTLPKNLSQANASKYPATHTTSIFPSGCPLPSIGTLKFNRH
jgi:heat shock protein 4